MEVLEEDEREGEEENVVSEEKEERISFSFIVGFQLGVVGNAGFGLMS